MEISLLSLINEIYLIWPESKFGFLRFKAYCGAWKIALKSKVVWCNQIFFWESQLSNATEFSQKFSTFYGWSLHAICSKFLNK